MNFLILSIISFLIFLIFFSIILNAINRISKEQNKTNEILNMILDCQEYLSKMEDLKQKERQEFKS